MAMERVSAEDQIMLWPDAIWPQENGALVVLDGAGLLDPDGRFRIEAVRQAIGSRLHLVPRFRQVLRLPRRGLGRPVWIDDQAFDLTHHVRVAPLPAPRDEQALLQAIEQLRRQRLDRSRPLWEMAFIAGLPCQQVGMFIKIHHVLGDGIAAVATASAFLDTAPDAPVREAPAWAPEPAPTTGELLADNLRRRAREVGSALSALVRPVTTVRHVRAAWPATRELFASEPATRTSLNRLVGQNRSLTIIRSDLELVRRAAHLHNATINDVLLSITAGGLRTLLRSRGELTQDAMVRAYVPVTLRHGPRDNGQANLIGQMVVPLPIAVPDAGRRLRNIARETATRKARNRLSIGTVFRSRIVSLALLKVVNRSPVNVTTADLPGPRQSLYFAGARVLEMFPVLPLIGNVSLGVGALSYAGQFNIAAIADRDAYPDLEIFAAGLQNELSELNQRARLQGRALRARSGPDVEAAIAHSVEPGRSATGGRPGERRGRTKVPGLDGEQPCRSRCTTGHPRRVRRRQQAWGRGEGPSVER
jgi:diacylglycerol O-acyltransferase / wax synthase